MVLSSDEEDDKRQPMKKVTSQSSKDGAFMKGKKKPTKIKDL